jgi:hypothetical protein
MSIETKNPAIASYKFKTHANADARKRSAINLVKTLLQKDLDILAEHRKECLTIALWKLTEAEAQHKHRTRFCSENARHAQGKELRHDHVFQRANMIRRLLASQPDEVEAILGEAVACTITRKEHRLLNQYKHLDGWERYSRANIAYIENEESQ